MEYKELRLPTQVYKQYFDKSTVTMKNILVILTIIFLFGCNESEKKIEIPENDWNQSVTAFKELDSVLSQEKSEIWNYSLKGALMFVNRETRTIIANENDKSGKLMKQGAYFVGKLPDKINISNTAFDWNGKRWTMLALPLPKRKVERLNYLIHESYHRIQPLIGFDSLYEIQSLHLDSKHGRIYLKLELTALKKALNSVKPEIHIKNALRFRQYRHQIIPEAKKAENSLELNEGLAEYTGSILSQRKETELIEHYVSEINRFYSMPTFVRSFPYFTIPVYGYFMQKQDKSWNLQIQRETNITEFMFHFWNIEARELTTEEVFQLGKEYGIETIIKHEQQRELNIEEIKAKYKQRFLSDSALVIGLEKMSIGFDPSNIMPLDSFGTVYPYLRITDNWGILKVDSGGALISPEWNTVTVSSPLSITDTLISGKGWHLKLDRQRDLKFIDNKYVIKKT